MLIIDINRKNKPYLSRFIKLILIQILPSRRTIRKTIIRRRPQIMYLSLNAVYIYHGREGIHN